MRDKTLTVIIPVSLHESIATIQNSMDAFSRIDFSGFNEKIVYAIDAPQDTDRYYNALKLGSNMEILWVLYPNTELKQAGAYNAGIWRYPMFDYYAFFDVDALPKIDFFQECAQVDADFVTCNRYVSNEYQNDITETVAEEYGLCNAGRRFMNKYVGVYFPASCTGLIKGEVLWNFRFMERTSADSELYRHILQNDFSMGYSQTYYVESAPSTKKQLYNQRLRWESDIFRTFVMTVGSGNSWKVNISNLFSYFVGMFPLLGGILAIPYMKHIQGYNMLTHILFLQYISLIALANTVRGDDVEWV